MKNEPTELLLISARTDEEGDMHAIYQLPHPIPWVKKHFHFEEGTDARLSPLAEQETMMIDRVRICVTTSEWPFPIPALIIIPIDAVGDEWPLCSRHFRGKTVSTFSALILLGFQPHLSLN